MTTEIEDDTVAQLVREVRALRAEVALVKRVVITVREDLDNERQRLDKEIGYIGQIVRALRAEDSLVKRVATSIREDLDNERRRLDEEIAYTDKIDTWQWEKISANARLTELMRIELNGLLDHTFSDYDKTMLVIHDIIGESEFEKGYYLPEERRVRETSFFPKKS